MRRRLAAILFADVAGYSRLMGADEGGTLAALERHVEGVLKPRIRTHGGRITSIAGDGFLAAFPSALEAVTSALEIQADMRERNSAIEDSRKFQFRIGLHLSEVVVKDRGRGVAGDGVNIAARIQALAAPGEIYVTDTIEAQVRGKIEVAFHDLGSLRLKNIARPVHVLAMTPVGVAPVAQKPVASSKASVAVLPFLNLSSDPESAYFSDGFADDLITTLSRFRTLSVIARNSSFVYRGQNVDVRKVGQELGVQFVIEGSMRRLKDSTRITVQLVDAVTSHHVWADKYDVPSDHVFAIQDDIIRSIVGRLVPRMEEEGLEIARHRPTEQPEAYYQYLRGKSLLYGELDAHKFNLARTHLERAVQLDPTFAAAYCFLAMIYNTLNMYLSPGEPLAPYRERAWEYAQRAAEYDDNHAHTHTTLAWCYLWRGEFDIARVHVDRAEALNPNDADQALARGLALVYLGDVDAGIACIQAAIRLNPFHSSYYLSDLAEAYYMARRYHDMMKLAERIPELWIGWIAWKAAGYAQLGDTQKAEQHARRFVDAVQAIWAGKPGATVDDYVNWLLEFSPFRRAEDREHFLQGLSMAGLTTRKQPTPGGKKVGAAGQPKLASGG